MLASAIAIYRTLYDTRGVVRVFSGSHPYPPTFLNRRLTHIEVRYQLLMQTF